MKILCESCQEYWSVTKVFDLVDGKYYNLCEGCIRPLFQVSNPLYPGLEEIFK